MLYTIELDYFIYNVLKREQIKYKMCKRVEYDIIGQHIITTWLILLELNMTFLYRDNVRGGKLDRASS